MSKYLDTESVRAFLSFAIVGMFMSTLAVLVFIPIPMENKDYFNVALGALIGAFTGGAVGFYFGTSSGSSAKDETIAALAPPKADSVTTMTVTGESSEVKK
jgi:hypothetical protein